ncbi:hypothetical protein KYB31_15765 [Clostridium felsineum]|uniref:hypothetical protein n=1 Tax=Clostridium felsineum TaxID=36839 RepID=UPI00214D196B|nr:hypothetical protein [Clostridium felsineum]MCR3760435.1 hypothetical protein [Clostridium felsineum]
MITKFSKWILYISSYIPLYLIYIVNNTFDVYSEYEKIRYKKQYSFHLLLGNSKMNIIIIIIFGILILASASLLFLIIYIACKSTSYNKFYCIEKNNEKINEYILMYVVPFITMQSDSCKDLFMFLVIFIVIGIISVKNDLVYVNPVLYFFKYNIYVFKQEGSTHKDILITKYSIVQLKRLSCDDSNSIHVRASSLSEGVYFIKK